MAEDAHAHLVGQVQTLPVLFEEIHHTQGLLVVTEGLAHDLRQRDLARVAEGRVTEVVAEGDRLGKILIQAQRPRDRSGDSRDLQGVRHARAVMIALRLQKDLRLVHQAAEGFAVQNTVGIALVTGAHVVLRLGLPARTSARGVGKLRFLRKPEMLLLLKAFSDRHSVSSI